jgi:uncharacterized protein (TIGR03000 family)
MTERWFKKAWSPLFVLAVLAAASTSAAVWAGDSPTSTGQKARRPVQITIRVPDGSQIWFDGEQTAQTGTTRVFVSPPLEPGRDYHYEVLARWQDGEGTVERTRRLRFRAGDTIGLDFSGRGFLEVRGYSDTQPGPVPIPAPARPTVPVLDRGRVPAGVAPFGEQSPMKGAGPPGSNSPMSQGVANG